MTNIIRPIGLRFLYLSVFITLSLCIYTNLASAQVGCCQNPSGNCVRNFSNDMGPPINGTQDGTQIECEMQGSGCPDPDNPNCFMWFPDEFCPATGMPMSCPGFVATGCCVIDAEEPICEDGQTVTECMEQDGEYQGNETMCDQIPVCNPPPPGEGCCVLGPNDCDITDEEGCDGEYQGDGVSCLAIPECNIPPADTGCCVFAPNNCADDFFQEDCAEGGGILYEPGLLCQFVPMCNIVPTPESDLAISKIDNPDPVVCGEQTTYSITVFNSGPDQATGVVITDLLPDELNFDSVNPDDQCMHANGTVTCNLLNPIDPFDTAEVEITVTADTCGPRTDTTVQNIVQVISEQGDPAPQNNVHFENTTIVGAGFEVCQIDLVTTKTGPLFQPWQDPFVYSIDVTNVSLNTAYDVVIGDLLPGGTFISPFPIPFINPAIVLDYPPFLPFGVADCTLLPAFQGFACSVDEIPPGGSVRVAVQVQWAPFLDFLPILFEPFPIFNVVRADASGFVRNTPDGPCIQRELTPSNNIDTFVTKLVDPPNVTVSDLVIEKSAPDVIFPLQQFGYFIEVYNLGPDLAQDVVVRDIVPDNVNFDTIPAGCNILPGIAPASDEMVCELGDMVNGEVRLLAWRATYDGAVPAFPLFRPVFNLATVELPNFIEGDDIIFSSRVHEDIQVDPETANNTDVAVARAFAPPPAINFVDLFVQKIDTPDPVVYGETYSYLIYVYNFGPSDAVDVVVTDSLPENVMVNPATLPDYCSVNASVVTCDFGLRPGPDNIISGNGIPVIIPIEVTAPLPDAVDPEPSMVLNSVQAFLPPTATLPEALQVDFAPSNNTDAEKTTFIPVPPPMSDLLIIKTDNPDPVIEDETLTYTIFVKNTGPDPAAGVLISDWLPKEGLDYTSIDIIPSPNVGECVVLGIELPDEKPRVECFIPSLGVEESATIIIKVNTLALPDDIEFLEIFNLAKVESIGITCIEEDIAEIPCVPSRASADKNPLNNIVVESTLIGPFVPIADVLVIKSDSPDPVTVGRSLTYTLFVSNQGPDPATDVIVTDTLPASVNFVSAVTDQGNCALGGGNVLTCDIGTLSNGAFNIITVVVTPTATGSIVNVAEIAAEEHDPNLGNNVSPETTTVVQVNTPPADPPGGPNGNDLFILKFVSPNPVEVGQEVVFTIIVGNNGEFGSGATVVDDLPAGLSFVSATANTGDPCNLVNGDVVCDIGTIPPLGQGQTVVVEVRAIASQTGTLPNTAFLDNVPNDPDTINNVSIVAVNVVPDISVPQPPPNPDPGDDGGDGGDGDTGGSNNSGCTVAAGSINTSSTAINFALLLLPLLVFGFRSIKRKK